MLSIENPPDPSCSSKTSALKTDEKASGQLAFQEVDPVGFVETQTPNFSIRDYVFASRSKGIKTNWPFPRQFLQLCLNHGIGDVLPPFEPPGLVRSQCRRKAVEPEVEEISAKVCSLEIKDVGSNNIEPKSCLPSDELLIKSSDQAQYPLPEEEKPAAGEVLDDKLADGDAEIASTVTSQDQIKSISDQISEIEVAGLSPPPEKLEISREPSEKKCRLVLKLSAISEARRAEDIASTSSTVSDPMASKVCPVCKIFSSTSNTTLNAHIDQCLSMESYTKRVVTKISKLEVKPRKKRLMEDIYATAPYCTLEDLDRRNGTSWATDLALAAPAAEACTEIKRPKFSPEDTRDDGDGAVYVDSNGIKLRILSKFNDTPPVVMPREEFKRRKQAKEIKEGKSLFFSKKKHFGLKYLKHMKVKPQSKKLSSFKLFKGEIQAAPDGDHHADTHQEKEEPKLQIVSAQNQVRSSGSATLRQWVCSKRSDLPKKKNKKDIQRSSDNPKVITNSPLLESNQPDSSISPVARSHILKFSRSADDLTSSPKTKRVDFLQTTGNEKKISPNPPVFNSRWSSESTLTNGLTLKLSRSSGTSISTPRSKREEIHMGSTKKCDNPTDTETRPFESCHPTLKAKKVATLTKNVLVGRPSLSLEASNDDVSEKAFSSKKFRKHRSTLVTSKRGVELPSDANGASKIFRTTHRPNFSKSSTSPRTEEIMNQMSPRSNIPELEQEREEVVTVEELNHSAFEPVPLGAEFHNTEVVTNYSMEKVDGDPVSSDTLISDNLVLESLQKVDPKPSGEQNVQSIHGSESHEEPVQQGSFDKHEMQCCNLTHDKIISQNIQTADEAEFQGEVDSHAVQCVESQAETVSLQESSACLTSHGDMGLEIPQENSSITSIKITSDLNHALAFDGEQSLSPVSTASTVSPPSPKASQLQVSEAELFERPESIGGTRGRDMERRYQEAEMVSLANERLSDGQPCCCSRREGLSREFQFLRQSIMAGTMLPSKGKQNSNLYIEPPISSFGSYASLRTESPTESISTTSDCTGFSSPSPSSQPQTPSTPNPILRLMGKNLMVMNKEESAQAPKLQPSPSDNTFPPLRFAPTGNVMNQEGFRYHHHHRPPSGSSVFEQHPSMANNQIPLHAGLMMKSDRQTHHKKLNKKSNPPLASALLQHQKPAVSSSRTPYVMKEVIVIDDSPETEPEPNGTLPTMPCSNPMVQQRSFSCFPSQSQFISRDVSGGFRPSFPNACPRELANPMKTSEGLRPPLLASPFFFQSPSAGHLGPSLYYSPTL